MHHKYAVRDGTDVWTGSTNWNGRFLDQRRERDVTVSSPVVASAFETNFNELWKTETVLDRRGDRPDRGGRRLHGRGVVLARTRTADRAPHRRGHRCGAAPRPRVFPGDHGGPDPRNAYRDGRASHGGSRGCLRRDPDDGGARQWRVDPRASWKIPVFRGLCRMRPSAASVRRDGGRIRFTTSCTPRWTVADDVVFTGSYNLSRSGMGNAENVLEIHDAGIAERLCEFHRLRCGSAIRYRRFPSTEPSALAGEEPPLLGDSFEGVHPSIREMDTRARNEILDGVRSKNLSGLGKRRDPRRDVHGDPGNLRSDHLALARVGLRPAVAGRCCATRRLLPTRTARLAPVRRMWRRSRRRRCPPPVHGSARAPSGRSCLWRPSVLAPACVANLGRERGRVDDVGEHAVHRTRSLSGAGRTPVTNSSTSSQISLEPTNHG